MNRKTTSFNIGLLRSIKLMLITTLVLLFSSQLNAQVTVSGGTSAAGSYTTIKAAADAISANPVTGAITVDVLAGHTETLPSRIDFTATGTASNTITFQKSGAGANPIITAYTGTNLNSSATTLDGMWSFSGSDYIIIDGINLVDSNTTAAGYMEYGYGFFKASATDGCNNNIIRNCSIHLDRNNVVTGVGTRIEISGASGILLLNATATLTSSALTATSLAGASSNNLFERNTIQDCNNGICIIGSPITTAPYTNADLNNTIGGSMGNGNSIINFGGGASPTGACAAVLHKNQWSANISFNTISNNVGGSGGINHTTSNRGIWLFNASPGASVDVNNNFIQIRSSTTGTTINWVIDCEMASTGTGNTININNNTFQACLNLAASTGEFQLVWLATVASTVNINNNIINNFQYAGTANAGFIVNKTAGIGTLNANNNKINGITYTGTGTKSALFYNTVALTNLNLVNNRVSNVAINTATSGTFYGVYTGSPTNGLLDKDTVENVAYTAPTSTGTIYGLYDFSSGVNMTYSNNIIRNFGTPTTGTMHGIREFGITGIKRIFNNTVSDFATYPGGTGGSSFNGIVLQTGSTDSIYGNIVTRMNVTGGTGGTNFGMQVSGGTTNYIFNNIVNDLSNGSTGGTMNGMTFTAGTTNHIYNNFISDIRTPSMNGTNNVFGMQLGGTTSTHHVSFNTINLGSGGSMSSAGAAFGVSGLYISSALTTAIIKNNIINVKATTASTSSWIAAFRRVSGTAGVKPSTITASNNIYYVTPATNSLIYGEGTGAPTAVTNPYFTSGTSTITGAILDANFNTSCGLYKIFMAETGTFTENNLTAGVIPGTFVPSGASFAESNATSSTIPSIGVDFAGVSRSTADIGALQFSGSASDATGPSISYTNIPTQACTNPPSLSAVITDASGVNSTAGTKPRLYFKKSTDANTLADWKFVESTSSSSPFAFAIDYTLLTSAPAVSGDIIEYFVVAQDNAGTANVGSNLASYPSGFCPTSVALPSGAFPIGGTIRNYTISAVSDAFAFASPDPVCDGSPVSLSAAIASPANVAMGPGLTTSATYSNPFYSLWSNLHHQSIIRASELLAAGIVPGPINSVSLNITNAGTLPMINLQVKIAHTSATTMASFVSPSFSTVFTSASYLPTLGENVLTFSTPFMWDGTSNIVLEFCHGNPASTATMSRTCLMDVTTYVSTIKTHITTAPGSSSATICGDVSSNVATYSTRPRYIFNALSGTVPVSTTWTLVPSMTAIGTSNPQSTTASFGMASTLEYAVTATDAAGCTFSDSVTVTKNTSMPTITATSLSRTSLCAGDSTQVSVTASLGCPPLSYLWSTGQTNATFRHTPSVTTTYTVTVTDFSGQTVTATAGTTTVNNPLLLSVQGDTICGVDTVQLNATGSVGSTINWYRTATGGAPFTTGNTYTTPVLSSDTTFWVTASQGGSNAPLGGNQVAWNTFTTTGAFQSSTHTSASMLYDVAIPLTINSLTIYPSAPLGTSFTVEIRNNSAAGTLVASYTGVTSVVNSGSPTLAQIVPVNWILPSSGQYSIGFVSNPNTWRSDDATFPLPHATIPGVMTCLGGSFGTATVGASRYIYYIYDLRVSTGCESPRQAVLAKVNPAVAISASATPSTPLCAGQSTVLNVTSANPAYVYTWGPGSLSGASHTVTPSSSTTYTVTAIDAVAQCSQVATVPVTVYQAITGTVSGGNIDSCAGTTTTITANPVGAGTVYTNDFSSSILDTTKAKLYGNSPSISGGRLQINSSAASRNGAIEIQNTTGIVSNDFEITFDLLTTPGSTSPADGISYSYGPDVVPLPTGTGSTVVNTTVAPNTTNVENGSGTKLKLSFDAYTNGANAAGIYLMYNCPVWNQATTNPAVLFYSPDVSWRATTTLAKTTAVKIVINAAGQVSLFLNGTLVLPPTSLPASYLSDNKLSWKHVFAGRTGAEFQGQFIDNLDIKYSNIYEYSDDGFTTSQTSPVFVKTSGTWPISVRYIANPTCPTLLGTVTVAPYSPIVGTVTSSTASVCVSGTPTLTVTGNGPEIQWQSSTTSSTTGFTDVSGATNALYTPSSPITTTTWYRVKSECITTGAINYSSAVAVIVLNPTVTSITPNTRCGVGTTTLSATGTAGTIIRWYDASNSYLATGNSFTTPTISSSTTYKLEASITGTGTTPVGLGATTSTTYPNPFYSLWSNTHNQYLITASELAASGVLPGNINSIALDITAAGTLPMLGLSVKMGHTSATSMATFVSPSFTTVHTSASYLPTLGINTLSFSTPFNWDGVSNVVIEFCHGNPASTATMSRTCKVDNTSYVSTIHTHITTAPGTSGATICGDITSNLTTYSIRPQFIVNGNIVLCSSSPRDTVVATVTAPPALVMGDTTNMCLGTQDTLSVSSVDPGYTYTWSPGSLSGATPLVTPTSSTTYTVTATNTTSGCVNVGTQRVLVNRVPASVSIISNPAPVCYGLGVDTLVATGGLSFLATNITVSGTSPTTSTGTNTPLYRNFEGFKRQYLVRASELTALGYGAGQLTSLSYNVTTLGASPNHNFNNLNISIGHTGAVALTSTFQPTPSLPVFSSPLYNAVLGANTFTFSTPFNWDGTSNILIEMCHDNDPSGSCTAGSPVCWGNIPTQSVATTPFVSVTSQYSDNDAGTRTFCTTPTGTIATSSIRPVITFAYLLNNPTNRYTWTPATGLFIDAAGTTPYTAGALEDTVYARPSTTTSYTATSTIISTACFTNSASASVIVNAPGTGGCPSLPTNDSLCKPMNVTTNYVATIPYYMVGFANINPHTDTINQSNIIATNQVGEPIGSCGGAGASNKTLWYRLTTPFCSTPQLHISTDARGTTDFDTRISVYRRDDVNNCNGTYTEIACNDNGTYYLNTGLTNNSSVVLSPNSVTTGALTNEYLPGEDIYVQTSGVGSSSGNYGLIIDAEPFIPTLSSIGAGSVVVDWSPVLTSTWGNISGAYIQWRPVGAPSTVSGTWIYKDATSTTHTITGLMPGVAYEVFASYVCGNGGRWWSKKATFTTNATCTVDTIPTITSIAPAPPRDCRRPSVTISAPGIEFSSYKIVRKRGSTLWYSGSYAPSASITYVDSRSLTYGLTYQYYIVGYCGTTIAYTSPMTNYTACSASRMSDPSVEETDVVYTLPTGEMMYGLPFNEIAWQMNEGEGEINLQTTDANTYFGREVVKEAVVAKVGAMSIYPNPATSEATISYTLEKEASSMVIRVLDAQGKEMMNETIANPEVSGIYNINLNNYSAGIYFVRIQAGDYTDAKKLVVDRR